MNIFIEKVCDESKIQIKKKNVLRPVRRNVKKVNLAINDPDYVDAINHLEDESIAAWKYLTDQFKGALS